MMIMKDFSKKSTKKRLYGC